jgi:hypothetical protein
MDTSRTPYIHVYWRISSIVSCEILVEYIFLGCLAWTSAELGQCCNGALFGFAESVEMLQYQRVEIAVM